VEKGDENSSSGGSENGADSGHRMLYDMKLYSYQSQYVQTLTLTSLMCLPPTRPWVDPTPAVRVLKRLPASPTANATSVIPTTSTATDDAKSAHISDIGSVDGTLDFEDYDVEGDDEHEDDEDEANDESFDDEVDGTASSPAVAGNPFQHNAFANWLGAIAAKTNGTPLPAPPPGLGPLGAMPMTASANPIIPEAPPASSLPSPLISVGADDEPAVSVLEMLRRASSSAGTTIPAVESSGPAVTPVKADSFNAVPSTTVSSGRSSPYPDSEPVGIYHSSVVPRVLPDGGTTPAAPSASQLSPDLMASIQHTLRQEIQSSVLPEIRALIENSVDERLSNVVQSSLEALTKKGVKVDSEVLGAVVSHSLDEPLRQGLADNVRNVLIPSLEQITAGILAQVSSRMEQLQLPVDQLCGQSEKIASATHQALEASTNQIAQLTTTVKQLDNDIQVLRQQQQQMMSALSAAQSRSSSSRQHSAAAAGGPSAQNSPSQANRTSLTPPPAPAQPADPRREILSLIEKKQYDPAFTKAVSSNQVEITVFCISNAPLKEVLGGARPALSQPILLCLMQQLGTCLVTKRKDASELSLSIEWLREIALCLDPTQPEIKGHVRTVLQQLISNIHQQVQVASDPLLKRDLQRLMQVVRGLLLV
jgi:hypothetical protein